ncbi:ribulose-phosphate 3-epimerase [Corynebacterium caspium]|uniref:ribulose-phosphate 3-epimerase n=1 Tax=Corynebacterium caspium TaxID=234828 RepID=UPI000376AD81|nr:ribulose-phosphate 3-epimerase [Corynebacterium caspium]WKD59226.1 Ribulose-phosphate 3-epimerase [Corynebacterium caspium DSM 44850]
MTTPAAAPLIAPSMLAADFGHLEESLNKVSNADWIHVDIMDGHFVPNISFGPDIAKTANQITDQPLDLHLMITSPEKWVDQFIAAGADSITFHVEAMPDKSAVVELARYLRSQGCRAAVSIKPGTAVEDYLDILPELDMVLVMSVEPGFGGQSFMEDQLAKVVTLRQAIDSQGLDTLIEIDGGISAQTIEKAAAAGVDMFVAGSAVFGTPDPAATVQELRDLATAARN